MLSPVLDDYLRLLERVEDFAVEQFVTEFRVEALAIAVFPWTARHDVGGLGTHPAIHSRSALAMNSGPLSERIWVERRVG